jgi:hypothetical protein
MNNFFLKKIGFLNALIKKEKFFCLVSLPIDNIKLFFLAILLFLKLISSRQIIGSLRVIILFNHYAILVQYKYIDLAGYVAVVAE